MKLTPTQIAILDHRLSTGNIPDVLAETEELGISLAEAEAAAASVARMIEAREIPMEKLSRAEQEVLADCIEGSTYFCDELDAIALGQTTRGKQYRHHAAADHLEKAFSIAFGRRIRCVRD